MCESSDVPGWDTVQPILDQWCTSCHAANLQGAARGGAPEGLNFDSWSTAAEWAADIGASVAPGGTMPPLGGMSQAERDLVRAWASCGAPGSEAPLPSCDAPQPYPGDLFVLIEADTHGFCEHYNAIDGKLQLVGLGVDALDCLCEVTGDLVVSSPWVTDLSLPHLRSIGGNLSAIGQTNLRAVDLPSLDAVGGELRLVEDNLQSVSLPRLASVGASLLLQDDATLEELVLPDLTTIGGSLVVTSNDALTRVELPELTEIAVSVDFEADPALVALDVSSLRDVRGALALVDLAELSTLTWPSLEEVGGSLEVIDCDALETLESPPALGAIGADLRIRSNAGLLSVDGFDGISRLGTLSIAENRSLERVTDFSVLQRIDVQLTLAENETLRTLPQLPMLQSLGDRMEIVANPALERIEGFEGLETTLATLIISDNPLLTEVDGLRSLRASGELSLLRLSALEHIDGLARLTVARSVSVEGTGLTDLRGLAGLEVVEGDLEVLFNAALVDITDLGGVQAIGRDLLVGENPVLPEHAIWDLLEVLGEDTVGGTIYVDGNAL